MSKPSENRVFSPEFKAAVARRILDGASVSALHAELNMKRSVLYRWRDAYRQEGMAGLAKPVGRPPGSRPPRPPGDPAAAAQQRIATLERKIAQLVLENDFSAKASQRVKELRQQNGVSGAAASTESSKR